MKTLRENPYQFIAEVKKSECTPAQMRLQRALIELNGKKTIDLISVRELCKKAAVARSTFYAYYDNIIQLKEQIEDDLIWMLLRLNQDLNEASVNPGDPFPFFQNTCQFIKENHSVFWTFLISAPNLSFIQKWQTAVQYHLWNRFFKETVKKNEELILEITASQAIAAYRYWLKNPDD